MRVGRMAQAAASIGRTEAPKLAPLFERCEQVPELRLGDDFEWRFENGRIHVGTVPQPEPGEIGVYRFEHPAARRPEYRFLPTVEAWEWLCDCFAEVRSAGFMTRINGLEVEVGWAHSDGDLFFHQRDWDETGAAMAALAGRVSAWLALDVLVDGPTHPDDSSEVYFDVRVPFFVATRLVDALFDEPCDDRWGLSYA